jgi:hypothetical protein
MLVGKYAAEPVDENILLNNLPHSRLLLAFVQCEVQLRIRKVHSSDLKPRNLVI